MANKDENEKVGVTDTNETTVANTDTSANENEQALTEKAIKKMLKDVEKQAAEKATEIIKAAEEKAAENIKMAEEKATEIISSAVEQVKETPAVEDSEDFNDEEERKKAEELVEITLFKDNNLYRDDVYVAVNGENIKFKRGVPVKIPRKFANALADSMRQDAAYADLTEQLGEDYKKRAEALE